MNNLASIIRHLCVFVYRDLYVLDESLCKACVTALYSAPLNNVISKRNFGLDNPPLEKTKNGSTNESKMRFGLLRGK